MVGFECRGAPSLAFPDNLAGSGFLSSPSRAVVLAAARPPPQLRTCSRILFASDSPLVSEAIKSAAADIAKFEGLGAAGASGSPTALSASGRKSAAMWRPRSLCVSCLRRLSRLEQHVFIL
jgi:hypothetical protein